MMKFSLWVLVFLRGGVGVDLFVLDHAQKSSGLTSVAQESRNSVALMRVNCVPGKLFYISSLKSLGFCLEIFVLSLIDFLA